MKQFLLELLPLQVYLNLRRWNYRFSHKQAFENTQHKRKITTESDYSYKPYDDKKAIFVHIPKCAGVSLNETIFGGLAGGHTTFDEYLNIFEPNCITDYFKFTIVRNPWDRLVSAYFFLKNGGFNELDKAWFSEELGVYSGFEDFVRTWLNKKNIWKWYHFQPQYHYILEKRKMMSLDFIGFLENIDEDFMYISKRIGVNCSLPSSNKSKHATYTNYYTDETKNIVAEVYAEDIKLLGYNFDNSSLPLQIANRSARKDHSICW